MNHIKLYKIPLVIDLTLMDHGVRNNNMPFRDSDFNVYKNTFNPIEFVVRDNDRKPVSLVGKDVRMVISSYPDNQFVLTKPAEIIDEYKGTIRVTLEPNDTVNWSSATFKYTMVIDFDNGTNNLLFIDQNQNASGFFTLIGDSGGLPDIVESVEADGSSFTTYQDDFNDPVTYYISSAFPGDAYYNDELGIHTVAVYADGFIGKFWVQASLEDSAPTNNNNWFDIYLTSYTSYFQLGSTGHPFSGIEPFNFEANLRWIRFKYLPAQTNTGTITKVLYKN